MSAADPEAALDYSNRDETSPALGALGSVLLALGFAGAILAVVATFTPVIVIHVLTVTPKSFTGYERHSVALVLLGVFGALMVFGAARGGARPAMVALAATGLAVLLIAVLADLPHLNDTGIWPQAGNYEDATAGAGAGYYLETASGVLMLASGVALALIAPGRSRSV